MTVGERLRDARAEVEGLLKQLAEADTDSERAAVKAQLRFQRQRVAALRASLNDLRRRANFSRVSVQLLTGDASAFPASADDRWTIDDALGDAGRILAVAAGVILVGLAVLAPIALIALLAWLGRRAWVRAGRERALEAETDKARLLCSDVRSRRSVGVGLEVGLAGPADRAEPVVGDVLEGGARGDAAVGVPLGWVVDEPARGADPLLLDADFHGAGE